MILSISAVSAADIDDNSDVAVQAVDEASIASVDVDEIASTDNADVLAAAGDGNFTELQNSVDSSGTVIMSKDYTRVDGENTISISRDVTILGNNHKIDGNNLGGIFNVNSGYTLTLMGLTLINGNAENGGAVYNNGGTLTIVNSYFLNNTATKSGGAIYNDGGSMTVTGSTFDGNDLTDRSANGYGGAAIYSTAGDVLISSSTITNNLKDIVHRGGTGQYTGDLSSAAVTSKSGTLTVSDSYFGKNSGSYGGAILSQGDDAVLNVVGSTFEDNFAFNGGAIDIISSKYTISNSTFRGNNAKGTGSSTSNYANGGAICAQENDNDDGVISDCTFEDNTAAIGGAITTQIAQVTRCTFTNNTALSSNSESFNGKTNNKGGFGGAVYNDNTITIEDSTFTDNIGRGRGLDLKNADISGSSFTNTIINVNNKGTVSVSDNLYDNAGKDISSTTGCTVVVTVGNGEIPLVTSGTIIFDGDLTFQDLQDIVDAGNTAITLTGNVLKSDEEEQTFANGILINHSFAIYAQDHTITANNGKVFTVNEGATLSLYKANVVGDGTTAIVNNGQVSLSLTNPSTFTNVGEFAIDNQGTVSQTSLTTFTQLSDLIALVNGGEIYIGQSKITKADDEKAAFADGIVIEKDLTIRGYFNSYYKYIDTKIDADNDGRIFSVNDGATLTLQKIILTNGNDEKGGAVYVEANNNFYADTVNFINNTATYRGGAIYSEGFVNVTNCVFDSNDITFRTANDDNGGAAIYNLRGILLIKDSKITNNLKDIVIRDGNSGDLLVGAVVTSGETIIDNVYFANNTGSWGGAISSVGYLNPDDYVLSVLNSKFEGNNATFGGAIFVESSNLDVRNCTFENNRGVGVGSSGTSDTQGGAIVIFPGDSHAEIIDSTFIGNSANLGGAVSFPGVASDTFVDNCTFVDNSAVNGGAVYFFSEEGSLSVSNSDFIGNDASAWGGAICVSDNASITITESNFEENTAAAATIVTFGSSSLAIDGCNFTENANTYDWGVVTVYSTGDADIKNSEFINDVTGSIAIDVENNANVNVEDSKISTTNNYGIWAGDGNLSLENNDISSAYVPVITSGGTEIVSTVRANISENKTYNRHLGEITVTINLTDDSGNLVYDANLKFVVYKDGEVVFNESASFDGEKYTGTFTPTKPGTYLVTLDYPAQEVATAVYVVSSSLTDLKNKIDNAETMFITLDIDYAYIAEFDEGLEDGIVIDKNIIIDGNGSTISGANLARLFNVTSGYTLVLGNLTVCDAKADKGAGIYVNEGAGLLADKVNFINNTAVYRGGAIYSEGTVVVTNSVFDSNDITFRTANDDNGGAAIYNLNGTLAIYSSNITNNLKDIVIRDGNKGDLLVGAVVTTGKTDIYDSYFANNTGSWGGAISSLGYMNPDEDYVLTVKNTKFEGNNATFGGAIFVESSNLEVDNCTFENNKGVGVGSSGTSNTQGGAIVVFPSGAQATITDSKFISNVARVGGAVSFAGVDGDSLIDNCTFVDNLADDGGAFYFWSGSATITVTDSDFINNAAAYGGAIENEGDSDLIVDNCTFVENYATTSGGAIISAANTSVSNSVFENNEAPSSTNAIYVWYPDSTLTLSNNTIIGDAVQIYTRPGVEIVNQLNATFLNNKTIPAEQGNIFILNATLTDDKGNFIYDADFRFSVNGETIDDISFDKDTGLYTVDYYIGTAGSKVISTNYEATGLTKYTGVLDVPTANVTEFTVSVDDIVEGENATVVVTLAGVNDEGLNASVTVIINNKEYTINVVNGTGNRTFEDLGAGQYPVVAMFEDVNGNYNSAINSTVFYVKSTTVLTISVDAVVAVDEYPGVVTVIVTSNADGDYNITVGDVITPVTVENGVAYATFTNVAAGKQNATVTFAGNDNYNKTTVDKEFEISKATPEFTVEVSETTYPDAVEFTVTGTDGSYTIKVDDAHQTVIEVQGGSGTGSISGLAAGAYNDVSVNYAETDNYAAADSTISFVINKESSSVVIDPVTDTIVYPGAVNITVTATNGEATVVVKDANDQTVDYTVVDGKIVLTGLAAGTYNVTATIADSETVAGSSDSITFTVEKAAINPTVNVPEKVAIDENFTVTVSVPETYTGNVVVEINGNRYDVNQNISLAEGSHDVKVIFDSDDNYNGVIVEKTLVVTKDVVPQDAVSIDVPENTTTPTFTIDLPKDATGYLLVDVDGEQYHAPIVDGSASITTFPLSGGNHTAVVTYTGDEKYAGFEKPVNVTIASNITADTALDVPTSSESDSPTFSVNLPSDATGYLTVEVDGKKYAAVVENGTASVTVPGLSDGNHNVTVSYSGDGKYPSLSKDATVNVHVPVYGITENKNVTAIYSATANYKVLVTKDGKAVGAGESVTFTFNGKTYTVKTDSNGYATLKLNTKVKVKSYTVTAKYKGVKVTNKVTISHVIKTSNKRIKKSAKVTKVKIVLKKVNGKVLKSKTLKVKFRGKTYKVKTNSKGAAYWKVKNSMVSKLKVGKKYRFKVTYGKDALTKKITIKR